MEGDTCIRHLFEIFKFVECPIGTYGENCTETCPHGKFGEFCLQPCECEINQLCNFMFGCLGIDLGLFSCLTIYKVSNDHKISIVNL